MPDPDDSDVPDCPEPVCIERADSLEDLMRYAETIRVMSVEAQQREFRRVEARFSVQRAVTDRFMLALLLSVPESTLRNDARARELLSEYVERNRDDSRYRSFAKFLLRGLNERRALEQAMDTERKQALQLRKQVDELKAIEQHMDKREQAKEQRGNP